MKYGLSDKTRASINAIFVKHPKIDNVILYGSRAKGTHHEGSDIDLTLVGDELELVDLYAVDDALDELNLPYTIDLSLYGQIDNEELIGHIERRGEVFYDNIASASLWEIKPWKDVLEIRSGRNQKAVLDPDGEYPILGSAGKIMGYANSYLCEKGTTIVGRKGTIDNPLYINTKFWNVDTAFGLVAGDFLDKKYLYYFCRSFDFKALDKGTTLPSLVKKDLLKVLMPVPPINEQKRIIAILDQAFAEIEKARANAEQNLKNARELFESYLQQVFSQPGDGWVEKSVGEILALEYGKPLDKSLRKDDGIYPAYGANGVKAWSDQYYCNKPTIIVGRKGSAGELTLTEEKFWPLDVTYFVSFDDEKYQLTFIYYLLSRLNLPNLATGVKPGINRNNVYALHVPVPSLDMQKVIVVKLTRLSKEILNLETIYTSKLDSLDELKKSILQKAFTGELTKEAVA